MRMRLAVVLFVFLCFTAGAAYADGLLLDYVQKPDASFHWEMASKQDTPTCPRYILKMTSQTWQGVPWTHDIALYCPKDCKYSSTTLLIITFGNPDKGAEALIAGMVADRVGCPVAILYGIPNQPLFDGLREDNLIAYTFTRVMETGDPTWALLLPMTKAAVKAMDVVQDFSRSEMKQPVTGFVVMGASKRGWTTWLTAASDPTRVKGIIPIVYDNLSLRKQMAQQMQYFGKYSNKISPYTERNLQQVLASDEGERLSGLVDPWAYRDRITMPKLIVNGANDPYWTVDSLNLYWDELSGPKSVIYVPNGGHDLGMEKDPIGALRLVSSLCTFVRGVASNSGIPELEWKYQTGNKAERITVSADKPISSATLWVAKNDSLDFADAKWEAVKMEKLGDTYTAKISIPDKGYMAMFGDVIVGEAEHSIALSTQMRLIGK